MLARYLRYVVIITVRIAPTLLHKWQSTRHSQISFRINSAAAKWDSRLWQKGN